MNTVPFHTRTSQLVPCFILAAMTVMGAAGSAEDLKACAGDPTFAEADRVQAEVNRLMCVAYKASKMDVDDKRILWLTGDASYWTTETVKSILRWVAKGNVCWMDTDLAPNAGLASSHAGSVRKAVVAEGAQNHPVAQGVSTIEARDTFQYARGLPKGAVPIMVQWNRPDHVVVAVWPVEQGVVIFLPKWKPNIHYWPTRGERRWAEPYVGDGRRLIHNINLFTLDTLEKAGPVRPPGLKPPWGPKPLLEAFGGIGH